MINDFEFIVVGAGGMGSAAAYHVARAGRSILLLEQFEIGHERGSSHGESRIIRLSYDHPDYVQLAQSAYQMWAELEQECGEVLLQHTGGLDISAPRNPRLEACLANLSALRIPRKLLTADDIRRRFPQFRIADNTIALYQPDAGILSPVRCVKSLAQRAASYGATILEHSPARSIQLRENGAIVVTETESYRCRKLIVCAGPWAGPLLATLGVRVPLIVTQEQYAIFTPQTPEKFQIGQFPVFIHYGFPHDQQFIDYYGFPIYGHAGVKVGEHHAGPSVTADTRTFAVDPDRLQRLSDYARATLPDTHGQILEAATCLYTNTPDQHFVIDTLPGYPHVAIAAGFSGHGFKFAILVGQILADLTTRGGTTHPIEMFALQRFL
jgi:sarcosine oxidase